MKIKQKIENIMDSVTIFLYFININKGFTIILILMTLSAVIFGNLDNESIRFIISKFPSIDVPYFDFKISWISNIFNSIYASTIFLYINTVLKDYYMYKTRIVTMKWNTYYLRYFLRTFYSNNFNIDISTSTELPKKVICKVSGENLTLINRLENQSIERIKYPNNEFNVNHISSKYMHFKQLCHFISDCQYYINYLNYIPKMEKYEKEIHTLLNKLGKITNELVEYYQQDFYLNPKFIKEDSEYYYIFICEFPYKEIYDLYNIVDRIYQQIPVLNGDKTREIYLGLKKKTSSKPANTCQVNP